ncbi:hypothetical protein JL720_12872 [Aureococcus anophagefferens]|nr:hypothetical protein JL720_12872 [Aureococcus anophagefferens]
MPRSYDDFGARRADSAPSFEETSRRRLAAAGGRPAPRVRPVAGGKIYVVARVDDAGLLEALSAVASEDRGRSTLARRVERDELKHQLLESAIKREIIKAEELRREEKRRARAAMAPADRAVADSYAGAKPFAEQFQKEASKGSRYAAARDAFWGGDDDETDYQEEVLQFRAKQARSAAAPTKKEKKEENRKKKNKKNRCQRVRWQYFFRVEPGAAALAGLDASALLRSERKHGCKGENASTTPSTAGRRARRPTNGDPVVVLEAPPRVLRVAIPPGAAPGAVIHATAPTGERVAVTVPPNAPAGTVLQVGY